MRSTGLAIPALLLLGVLMAASPALAAQRYASPAGAGTDCTDPSPCSLRTAIESASFLDEVILKTGTYPVEASAVTAPERLDIHGESGGASAPLLQFTGGHGLVALFGSSVRDVSIFHSVGTLNGLLLFGEGATAERVRVRSQNGFACAIGGSILDSVCSAVAPGASGLLVASSGEFTTTARNVTAHSVAGEGIEVGAGDGGNVAIHATNTIALGGSADIGTTTTGSGVASATLTHSNFNSVDTSGGGSATAPGSGTNQTAAPLLMSPDGGDFHQLPGSPTIDAGVTSVLNGGFDFELQDRVQGLGTDIGGDEFPNAVTPPHHVSTGDATGIGLTVATLHGSLHPHGEASGYRFQYGTTTSYGSQAPIPDGNAGSSDTDVPVSTVVTGLKPGTTYHYRLVAANADGSVLGQDRTFRTRSMVCAGRPATRVGSAGRDVVRGTSGADVIAALGGNDFVRGLAGRDVICGGRGRDRLVGGRGRDQLLGQAGRDILRGGPGRDALRGGPGTDLLDQ